MRVRHIGCGIAAALVALLWMAPAEAQSTRLGPETRLPLPRFVSLNVNRANIRRGPGLSHRIDWEFVLRGAPLQIVAEHGHWRKVRDAEGFGGWIHHSLLRGNRTALVTASPEATLRAEPAADARIVARAEPGAVGQIERCQLIWCRFSAQGHEGWIQKADIWGVGQDEVFD
jgi:SH3-like domain-containing protein